jgi:uncharacterized protein YegL
MAKDKKVVITTTTTKAVKPVKERKKRVITTVTTTTVTEKIVTTPLNDNTHIICVLDRSGSMGSIMSDSIGGFNEFLRQQKKLPGKATITIHLFDDKHEWLYECADLKDVKEITNTQWYPRGTTALYDAIGKTINQDKVTLNRLGDEKPSKVLVCIVTDGYENASKEYKRENIQSLIKECENDDWNFIYLAANQNAFAVGTSFGISYANTYTYTANSVGVAGMSAMLNNATASYRSMSSSAPDFKKKSKSLINDDPDKDSLTGNGTSNSGTITTNGTNNITYTAPNTTNNLVVDIAKK